MLSTQIFGSPSGSDGCACSRSPIHGSIGRANAKLPAMRAVSLIVAGLIGSAMVLGAASSSQALADPDDVAVAPSGSTFYGYQDDADPVPYLLEERDAGVDGGSPSMAREAARRICEQRVNGVTESSIVDAFEKSGATTHQSVVMVVHAEWHFCRDALYEWPGRS